MINGTSVVSNSCERRVAAFPFLSLGIHLDRCLPHFIIMKFVWEKFETLARSVTVRLVVPRSTTGRNSARRKFPGPRCYCLYSPSRTEHRNIWGSLIPIRARGAKHASAKRGLGCLFSRSLTHVVTRSMCRILLELAIEKGRSRDTRASLYGEISLFANNNACSYPAICDGCAFGDSKKNSTDRCTLQKCR